MKNKFFLSILTLSTFINVNAARIYVDMNSTGSNNGSSWTDAYSTIEDALVASIIGDEIWVKSGVYKPVSLDGFDIPNGVKIYGGFDGTEISISERDLVNNITTLNGDIGTIGVDYDNANHVVSMSNVNNQTKIDGFRIINGNANNVSNNSKGGGLYVLNGSPTISNCSFISNKSSDFGGAIVSENGNITIEDCDINNNFSEGNGGGIYLIQSGTAIIKRTKIYRNTSIYGSGGGISSGNGVSSLVMDRCEISGNTAQQFGGAFTIGDDTDFSIYNSIIVGNISDVNTIYMHTTFNTGTHKIINCTFSGNKLGNSTSSYSTTIRVVTDTDISNSIFWDNDSFANIYRVGAGIADPSVNNCIVEGGYSTGTGNIDQDPSFTTPGTPTLSPFSVDDGYNYTLTAPSPAIDSGNNSVVSSSFNLDYLGNSRIINTTVDIGSYEYDSSFSINNNELSNVILYYNSKSKSIEFPDLINSSGYSSISAKITNISGQLVFNKTNITQNYIDVNHLCSGLYIIELMSRSSTKKLIITKKIILY